MRGISTRLSSDLHHRLPPSNLQSNRLDALVQRGVRGGSPSQSNTWQLAGLTLSLIKVIVGSGVLCLSGGLAEATDDPKQLLPAIAASLIFALLSAYTFALAGFVCGETGATTYGQAWASTVSPSTAWVPQVVCCAHTLLLCALYSVILGDLAEELAVWAGAPALLQQRSLLLWLLALLVQLPLCLLRSLAALSYSSAAGVCGIVYTILFMGYRYFQGEYRPEGRLWHLLPPHERPVFGTRVSAAKSAILLSILNTSYQAHYAAPSFFQAVPGRSQGAFQAVTYTAFLISGLIGCLILSFGFLTFGGASEDLILNSFVTADKLAVLARSATLLSLLGGYPLLFRGFATGLFELRGILKPSHRLLQRTAVATVLGTTTLAMVMRDLGLLCSLAGALFGSAVIYVFPALMHARLLRRELAPAHSLQLSLEPLHLEPRAQQQEARGMAGRRAYYASLAIIGVGVAMGVVGVGVPLAQAYTTLLD